MSAPQLKTGRQRASRIELDYYHRSDRIQRLRRWGLLVAVVLLLGYLALGLLPGGERRYSPGRISRAHAAWEQKCAACHTPFVPISKQAWAHEWSSGRRLTDQKCNACHYGATHHAEQVQASRLAKQGCVDCHPEHQGKEARLVLLSDATCTTCHQDLTSVQRQDARTSEPRVANRIRSFATDHPAFRSLQNDPGQLRFSHRVHMTAGLVARPGDRGGLHWADLPVAYRQRVRPDAASENGLVQLDCVACHEPSSRDPSFQKNSPEETSSSGRSPDRTAPGANGEYMTPVQFEKHCQACHPLRFEVGRSDAEVPHGKQLSELKPLLQGAYAARAIADQPELTIAVPPGRPLPGKERFGPAPEVQPLVDLVGRSVARAMVFLSSSTCVKCHALQPGRSDQPPQVTETNIPSVWLEHGRFNHRAHRAVSCRKCHAQAYPEGTAAAPDHEMVMIAGKETCLECHTTASQFVAGKPQGGVRSDCVLCHRYHVDPLPQNQAGIARGHSQMKKEE